MSAKAHVAAIVMGAALAFGPLAASAESPVFGNAKRLTLNQNSMEKVTGQGAIADYYGNKGYNKLINAQNFAYWGLYYNDFYSEDYYYWKAYKQAKGAMNQLLKAWDWAGQ
jgi:hypothetical protein